MIRSGHENDWSVTAGDAAAASLTAPGRRLVPRAASPEPAAIPAPRRSNRNAAPDAGTQPSAPPHPGGPATHRRRRPRRSRRATIAVLAVVAIAGGGVVVALGDSGSSAAEGSADSRAVAWTLVNLDPKATVLVPGAIGAALAAGGHDGSRLVAYGDGPSDSVVEPLCCGFLIVRAAIGAPEALPGAVEAAYDRSLPMAAFVDGRQRTEVRRIAGGTPVQIAASVAAERATLAGAGRELLAGDRLQPSPAARNLLLAGRVDARVVMALVGIVGRHRISVSDFPSGPGEDGADVPRRTMEIDRIDGEPVTAGSEAVRSVTSYLDGQISPYRPARAQPATRADGTVLAVAFPAPSPIGLLTPAR